MAGDDGERSVPRKPPYWTRISCGASGGISLEVFGCRQCDKPTRCTIRIRLNGYLGPDKYCPENPECGEVLPEGASFAQDPLTRGTFTDEKGRSVTYYY